MVYLLNIIPILIAVIGVGISAYFYFKTKDIKATIVTGVITFVLLWIYKGIQPSYIPKQGVAKLHRLEIVECEKVVISDKLLKPEMTKEERTEHFENKVITFNKDIDKILNKEKNK